MTATYTRGTKTNKSTTKSLQPGSVLLTIDGGNGLALVADKKTGAILRVVAGPPTAVPPAAYERNRRYIVDFTDGTRSMACAPSQTWMVAQLAASDVATTSPVPTDEQRRASIARNLPAASSAAVPPVPVDALGGPVDVAYWDKIRAEVATLEGSDTITVEVAAPKDR